MSDHSQFTDEEFLYLFRSCKLDEELFAHEAHLRLAWLNIKSLGLKGAIDQTRIDILNYVDHLGAVDKYHETVTVAAVKMIDHFLTKGRSDNFTDLILEFPKLRSNFKDLLARHYSMDIFSSEEAKKKFLKPDLRPFNS